MKQLFANSVLVEPVLPPAAQLGIHSLKRLILKIELLFLEGPKFTSTSPSSEGGRGENPSTWLASINSLGYNHEGNLGGNVKGNIISKIVGNCHSNSKIKKEQSQAGTTSNL